MKADPDLKDPELRMAVDPCEDMETRLAAFEKRS